MANVLNKVDERTKLVGHNRLELLLFRLDDAQRFGINVFKVREVVRCPKLNRMPHTHPAIIGVATMRGQTISVIDMQMAVFGRPIADAENASIIVAEYNRRVQGFLVKQVLHIINKNWEDIKLPPIGTGKNHYLTAVSKEEDELIEIIDVERVLHDVCGGLDQNVSSEPLENMSPEVSDCYVMVVDDSAVARNQIKRVLERIGVKYVLCKGGKEAIDQLRDWADDDAPELKNLALVISDVEMPVMDGYTFTSQVREDPRLQGLKLLLHTSLSGVFNSSLINQVKADGFLAKFDGDELVTVVTRYIDDYIEKKSK